MKRWIRAPARPSAVEAKSAVFCLNVRHLRRRGTSVCLVTGFVPLHGFGVDSVDGQLASAMIDCPNCGLI